MASPLASFQPELFTMICIHHKILCNPHKNLIFPYNQEKLIWYVIPRCWYIIQKYDDGKDNGDGDIEEGEEGNWDEYMEEEK